MNHRPLPPELLTLTALDAVRAVSDAAALAEALADCHETLMMLELGEAGEADIHGTIVDIEDRLTCVAPRLSRYLAGRSLGQITELNHVLWHGPAGDDECETEDDTTAETQAAA